MMAIYVGINEFTLKTAAHPFMKTPHKLQITVYKPETPSLLTRNITEVYYSVRFGSVGGGGGLEQMVSITCDYMRGYFSNKWKTE
jgi:hypothetical protein